ncbi:MAG: hypothetical protein Fur0043_01790 [Anaerolineales bacterium]
MHETKALHALLLLALLLSACNLPSKTPPTQGPDAILTAAAQTVEANLTQAAILNPPTLPPTSPVNTPIPTITLAIPTNSIPPSLTPLPTTPCDVAKFIDDVTVKDGTTFAPNESFTKTWRFKNIGTCSWTPSYALVFYSGDAMSGPATQALTDNVNPGQTVDISVNLKAPATDGNYKGYWKLRNASGVLFAQVWVEINVKTPAPSNLNITLNAIGGNESGTVYEPASGTAVVHGTILAGDTGSNHLARGYMSFDISALSGKTIVSAALDLSSCSQMQDPFGSLAGIWVGEVQYALPLDQSDYNISGTGIQLLNTLPGANTIDVKTLLQTRVNEGQSRFQIRLHPAGPTDGDGQADYMTCNEGTPKLKITYQP